MDLLFLLASEPNRVFLKEEIYGRLWPGVTVGEDSLARCVSKLRKALADDAEAPRFVETVAKRGYRLIAPVEAVRIAPGRPERERTGRVRLAAMSAAALCLLGLSFAAGRLTAPAAVSAGSAGITAEEARRRQLSEMDRAEAIAMEANNREPRSH